MIKLQALRLSPALIVIRMAVIIFAVEGLALLFLLALPPAFHALVARFEWVLAPVGAVALVLISSLVVYLYVIRPYILAQSRGESVLRESESRLNEAQRIARLGSWELDLKANALSWSDEIYRIFEIDAAKFGTTYEAFLDGIHPEDREMVNKAYTSSLANRSPYEITHRLLMGDGRIKWVRERCETTFGADGEPLISRGTVQDITEHKHAEEVLRATEKRLAAIVDIAPEAIISIDQNLRIVLFNQGAEAIFGYSAGEMVGQSLGLLLPARFQKIHDKHIESFSRSSLTRRLWSNRLEMFGLRKDGSEFPAEASISKLQRGGETILTVMLHDISERKRAAEAMRAGRGQAELANRSKSEFLANMSHELRTPLNAIIGFSEIMLTGTFGPIGNSKYLEYLGDINESGRHLLELINDILDLSKIEAGKLGLNECDVDVVSVIRSCFTLLKERANTGNLSLVQHAPRGMPALHADERMLKQILINLLSNAVKFTPEGGSIDLYVEANEHEGFTFTVSDTGIGLAAVDIPKVLMPFVQAESALDRKYEGTGLGLPLTKSLIELHGGTLDLHSEVGVGTTVTVRFPAERIVWEAATGALSPPASNPCVKKAESQA
ncbi:MAG: PAS domain-containing sensor histidine kinase [Alphaproteobacteria bacterium]